MTAYALAFGGLLLLGGRVVDFVGRKRVFMIGLVGFALASMVAGVASNGAALFAGRALQGAFAALLAPAALSLIAVTFTDGRERAKAFGVYGALQGAGGAVGLIAGGVLTEYANWRWCLFVNTPIALAAVAAIPTVRESRAEGTRRYDIPGAVLVTTGLVALVRGFTHAAEDGWSSGTTWILLAVGAILLIAFVAVEGRTDHPLLPLHVVLDRDRGGAFLASLLTSAGMFGLMLFLTYYLQVNLGYQPSTPDWPSSLQRRHHRCRHPRRSARRQDRPQAADGGRARRHPARRPVARHGRGHQRLPARRPPP